MQPKASLFDHLAYARYESSPFNHTRNPLPECSAVHYIPTCNLPDTIQDGVLIGAPSVSSQTPHGLEGLNPKHRSRLPLHYRRHDRPQRQEALPQAFVRDEARDWIHACRWIHLPRLETALDSTHSCSTMPQLIHLEPSPGSGFTRVLFLPASSFAVRVGLPRSRGGRCPRTRTRSVAISILPHVLPRRATDHNRLGHEPYPGRSPFFPLGWRRSFLALSRSRIVDVRAAGSSGRRARAAALPVRACLIRRLSPSGTAIPCFRTFAPHPRSTLLVETAPSRGFGRSL